MRVGLIADTHGIYDKLSLKLKDLDLDLILHAGDYAKDAEEISLISGVKAVAVRGNNDPLNPSYNDEEIINLNGYETLLIHGHLNRVHRGTSDLRARAIKLGAKIVIFGHTHKFLLERDENLLVINPGSPSFTRSFDRINTFVVLEIKDDGKIFIEKMEIDPF